MPAGLFQVIVVGTTRSSSLSTEDHHRDRDLRIGRRDFSRLRHDPLMRPIPAIRLSQVRNILTTPSRPKDIGSVRQVHLRQQFIHLIAKTSHKRTKMAQIFGDRRKTLPTQALQQWREPIPARAAYLLRDGRWVSRSFSRR